MLKSARFVIEKTITPVIDKYKEVKDLGPDIINEERLKVIKHTKDQAVSARTVISQFKKTGDLYKYLQSSISYKRGETESIMHSLKLTPFEDIMDEFKTKFSKDLYDCSSLQELIVENLYSTYDFIFLAGIYRTQTPAMLSIKDVDNNIVAVIARGSFENDSSESLNKYLEEDQSRIQYNFTGWKKEYFNSLVENQINVHFFEKIGQNKEVFKGVYKLETFDKANSYLTLKREDYQPKKIKPSVDYKFNYRKKYKLGKRTSGGHSGIGKLKEASGAKAENIVFDFLNLQNINCKLMSSENNSHNYDIKIDNFTNLEVKNISNLKGFYLSNSEIQEFKNGDTRICLVDIQENDELILISKPYHESITLKTIFKDLLEIRENTIQNYNGKYKIDSIEIGLIEPESGIIDDIYKDFLVMNNLSQNEIKNYLNKKKIN